MSRAVATEPPRRSTPEPDEKSSTEKSPFEAAAEEQDVELARGGDVAAFERLYRRRVGPIYALCLRMCGNVHEAEETTQETFIRCWEKLDTFRGESAFGSWLHRMAVNTVLGHRRSAGRYRRRVTAVEELPETPPPRILSSGPGTAMDLERAVAGLPEGARTVFVLHDVEGFKHREIAELTGLAEGTCKTQLHRARRLLRASLGGDREENL